jgi:hypothetical protein
MNNFGDRFLPNARKANSRRQTTSLQSTEEDVAVAANAESMKSETRDYTELTPLVNTPEVPISKTDDETPPTTNQIQAASTVSKQHIKSALPEITLSTVRSLIDKPLFCQLTSSTASTFHDEKQNSATPDSPNQNSNLLSEYAAGSKSDKKEEEEEEEEGEGKEGNTAAAAVVFEIASSELPPETGSNDPVVPITDKVNESSDGDAVVTTSTTAIGSSTDD